LGHLRAPDKVRKLRSALHAKAKAEPGYRFYALYDKLYREDVLAHAYEKCRANRGVEHGDNLPIDRRPLLAGAPAGLWAFANDRVSEVRKYT
jgi:hypothetical protein